MAVRKKVRTRDGEVKDTSSLAIHLQIHPEIVWIAVFCLVICLWEKRSAFDDLAKAISWEATVLLEIGEVSNWFILVWLRLEGIWLACSGLLGSYCIHTLSFMAFRERTAEIRRRTFVLAPLIFPLLFVICEIAYSFYYISMHGLPSFHQ